MDRRTLLAIALSFLVITIWSRVYGPKPRPTEETPPGTEEPVAEERFVEPSPAATTDDAPREEIVFSAPTVAAAEEFDVETPLYTATFSSRGGGIAALVLHEFVGPDGEPLQLVAGQDPEPILSISRGEAAGQRGTDFSDTIFEITRAPANGLSTGSITFTAASEEGARISRTFTLHPDTYLMEMTVNVMGVPVSDGSFDVAWAGGLPVTEKQRKTDLGEFKTLVRVGENIEDRKLGSFKNDRTSEWLDGRVMWAATRSKYFISALFLDSGEATSAELFGEASANRLGYRLVSPIRDGSASGTYRLYVGPILQSELAALGEGIDKKVGMGSAGGGLLGGFAKGIYRLMNACYGVIPNYGVVILILALATKIIFHPLTRWSTRKMREMQSAMAELKPRADEIQKKYKDDPMRGYREVQALHKKHGVSQTAGCLPMLLQMPIQIPIFWSLYNVLRSAIELRQAPFVLWINDLSAPDTLLTIGPLALHVLPILMAGTTILMQKKTMTAGPRQPAAMTTILPIMMLVIFYTLPSGLNLYWTAQNVLSWGEQAIIPGGKQTTQAKKAA